MEKSDRMKGLTNNVIAFIFGVLSVVFASMIFLESRNDPGLRMAALVSATSIATALLAIASTLLTGKDLTKKTEDLPPDATQITQVPPSVTTVKVDPLAPPATPAQE